MVKEVKTLKGFSQSAEKFQGSHLLCPGCGHGIIVREVLNAVDGTYCFRQFYRLFRGMLGGVSAHFMGCALDSYWF